MLPIHRDSVGEPHNSTPRSNSLTYSSSQTSLYSRPDSTGRPADSSHTRGLSRNGDMDETRQNKSWKILLSATSIKFDPSESIRKSFLQICAFVASQVLRCEATFSFSDSSIPRLLHCLDSDINTASEVCCIPPLLLSSLLYYYHPSFTTIIPPLLLSSLLYYYHPSFTTIIPPLLLSSLLYYYHPSFGTVIPIVGDCRKMQ